MKCLFVYNPVSGRGRTGKRLSKIVRALRERYGDVCVAATSERGDMTRIVRASAPLFDAIVFSGGDGTFNEALQGVCESGCSPELGYIPSGTVNDVAHSLGIPKRLRGALRVIRTGRPAALDCMKINDRYAMYIVAAGAFTSAPYTTPQSLKKQMGFIAYGIEGLKKNLRFDVFGVTLSDGRRTVRTDSVFVVLMNGRYVAGIPLNRGSSMADGKIEAALIHQRKNPGFFGKIRAFLALARLFLLGYRVREKQITRLEGAHFEIAADESVVWNFDGEKGIAGDVSVDVVPGRIRLLVPRRRDV